MIPKSLPQTIAAETCALRRLTMADAEPFYRFVSDDDSVQYMFFEDEQRTKDGARGMVEWVVNAYDTDESVCIFAIADKATGEYMGNLGAQTIKDTDETEFFYALLPQFRGQGHVTSAVKAFLRFMFDKGIQLAVAFIVPENSASIRVVNRLNARFAGEAELHGTPAVRYDIDRTIVKSWT